MNPFELYIDRSTQCEVSLDGFLVEYPTIGIVMYSTMIARTQVSDLFFYVVLYSTSSVAPYVENTSNVMKEVSGSRLYTVPPGDLPDIIKVPVEDVL
jgi:hypothetical protein